MDKVTIELANGTSVDVACNPAQPYARLWLFPNALAVERWKTLVNFPLVNIRETKLYSDWLNQNEPEDLFFSTVEAMTVRSQIRELRALGADVIWYLIKDFPEPAEPPMFIVDYDRYFHNTATPLELDVDYLAYVYPDHLVARKDLHNSPHRVWLGNVSGNKMRVVETPTDHNYMKIDDLTLGYCWKSPKDGLPFLGCKRDTWLEEYRQLNGFCFDVVIPNVTKSTDGTYTLPYTETVRSKLLGTAQIQHELLLDECWTRTTENVESYLDGGV